MRRQPDALRGLCRQSTKLLNDLGLAESFAIADLHAAVERRRERPTYLLPFQMPAHGPCGLWIAGSHADYVFFDAATSPVHQQALIGHEFGHILFDDSATSTEAEELAAMLAPDLDPGIVTRLLARTTYEKHREWRAEVFASVVIQRLGGWSDVPLPQTADPLVLARLAAALENPGRDG